MSGKTVLIVEDNREINDMLAAFLRENGWEAVCAYNGLEAASCLKNREYTVVLMDLMLPFVGGRRFDCRAARTPGYAGDMPLGKVRYGNPSGNAAYGGGRLYSQAL